MQIFLEGNELNYKTTVANKLAERLGYTYIKGSSFELATGTQLDMLDYFIEALKVDNAVVDRFIYSNYVYATLYPKYTLLREVSFDNLDWCIANPTYNSRLVVYLYADTNVLIDRYRQRGDEYIVEDKLEAINSMYEQCWSQSIVTPLRINTAEYTSDEIVDQIISHSLSLTKL